LYQVAESFSDWDSPKKKVEDVERNGNDLRVNNAYEFRVSLGKFNLVSFQIKSC